MKAALIIIDMQKQSLDGQTRLEPDLAACLEIVTHVASLFRESARPVIFVQDEESAGPGDPGFELINGLYEQEEDPRVRKVAGNAFRSPELTRILQETHSDFALLAGYRAENCVLATQKGAEDRDIPNALLRGGVLGHSKETVAFIESICPLLSHEVVAAML